jgi:hypothetical protein
MKGIYTVERKNGTQVFISYTPPDRPRVRRSRPVAHVGDATKA